MSTRLFLSLLWITTVIHSMDVTDVPFSLFPLLQKGNVIHIKYSCKALRKAMRNAVVNVNEENEAKKSVLWLLLEHFKESIHLIKQRNEYGNVKLLHNLYEHYKEKWLQKTILLMITKGLNLGYTYNGTSVLHKASMDGFEWLVDQITKRDITQINRQDLKGHTPLYTVLWGSFITYKDSDGSGWGLSRVCHVSIAKKLIEAGADANVKTQQYLYDTALHVAAGYHQPTIRAETIPMLLYYGADPTIKDDNGQTAYERAKYHGHTDSTEMLQDLSAINAVIRRYAIKNTDVVKNIKKREYIGL